MQSNNEQPEWENPESPLYYKGYRYKEDYSLERWYDNENRLRKIIKYNVAGNKQYELYYNDKFEYHNEDGPCYQTWTYDNKIEHQIYYLNDIRMTESEWKEEVSKLKNK